MPKSTLKLEPIGYRIATIVVCAVLVVILLLGSIWFIGDAIGNGAVSLELAELSIDLAPGNPKGYLAASGFQEDSFDSTDLKKALENMERAIALSPNDFLSWQKLARMREQAGDLPGAELALRRAAELAPNYASVQWGLGNLLLRRDKNAEAFQWIRKSVENNKAYASPAASVAWDLFEGDIARVKESIGNSGQVNATMAVFLSRQERYREAIEIWRTVPKDLRSSTYSTEGRALINNLTAGKKFIFAVEVFDDFRNEDRIKPEVGVVANGGFESIIPPEKPEFFEWTIGSGDIPTVGVSFEEKRSGQKSLAYFFERVMNNEYRSVSQTIALEGGKTYSLKSSYKSSMESDATMKWQIADTAGGGIIASTEPILKSTDWNTVETTFTVPENSEGVVIRLVREDCARLVCPINGTVWFDDVEVK